MQSGFVQVGGLGLHCLLLCWTAGAEEQADHMPLFLVTVVISLCKAFPCQVLFYSPPLSLVFSPQQAPTTMYLISVLRYVCVYICEVCVCVCVVCIYL